MNDIQRIAAAVGLPEADLAFLADLDAGGVTRLADRIEAAGPERDREVDEAIESGLKMVPRMLRGAVRRILFAGTR